MGALRETVVLSGMQVQREVLTVTVRVLKGEQRRQMTARKESENLTGLVRNHECDCIKAFTVST